MPHPLSSHGPAGQEGHMLLVDKSLGWTSFDVIKKLRNLFQIKKIGHAGTLDPLATGLLIVCTGSQTKNIIHYQALDKVYTGQLIVGYTSSSIDLETPLVPGKPWHHLTASSIIQAADSFIGTIQQIPPAYSAIKIKGIRAYQQARQGLSPQLEPRSVTVHGFKITELSLPAVNFEIRCSKGTYIRSLVRDMGMKLGVGAYLSQLRRTQIGPYLLQEAHSIESIALRILRGEWGS